MTRKSRISSDGQRCVSLDLEMIVPDISDPTTIPPKGVTLIIHTKQGKTLFGKWSDDDCVQWLPYPRKAKRKEM